MTQIGDLPPRPQAFPNALSVEADRQQQPPDCQPEDEQEPPLFVPPPPAPWPRVFPGL